MSPKGIHLVTEEDVEEIARAGADLAEAIHNLFGELERMAQRDSRPSSLQFCVYEISMGSFSRFAILLAWGLNDTERYCSMESEIIIRPGRYEPGVYFLNFGTGRTQLTPTDKISPERLFSCERTRYELAKIEEDMEKFIKGFQDVA